MDDKIPHIIQELYPYYVTEPNPAFWPDYLQDNPVKGHSLWVFYQGPQLGMQLAAACLD